jgi:SpoVK/Ycf46/Vps4 family AAA+-type ATPase
MAKKYAMICLENDKTQKNERFVKRQIEKLNNSMQMKELPYNVSQIAYLELPAQELNIDRIYISDREKVVADDILKKHKVAQKLSELNIPYSNTTMLYGESGTGKTTFARYVAYKMNLPLLYLNFTNVVDSLLGQTQKNLHLIFEFCRNNNCVLMLDEIDCIANSRKNSNHDVNEMNRVTVSVMQELDKINNDLIVIGATNILETIDPAILRRFSIKHQVEFLNYTERKVLIKNYFASIDMPVSEDKIESMATNYSKQNELVKAIIDVISETVLETISKE